MENLVKLIEKLRYLPNETTWVEFKHNNYDPKMIGEDISALPIVISITQGFTSILKAKS